MGMHTMTDYKISDRNNRCSPNDIICLFSFFFFKKKKRFLVRLSGTDL